MPTRRALIHDCEPHIDDDQKFGCSCWRFITSRDAKVLVAGNQAQRKQQRMAGGGLGEMRIEVILPARRRRLNAKSISAHDIDLACVQNRKYFKNTIAIVGQMQRALLTKCVAVRKEVGP